MFPIPEPSPTALIRPTVPPRPASISSPSNMAQDFKPYKVAVVSIWPGTTATERAKSVLAKIPGGVKILEGAETPKFSGLVIASLYSDPQRMSKSGGVVIAAEAALKYGQTSPKNAYHRKSNHKNAKEPSTARYKQTQITTRLSKFCLVGVSSLGSSAWS